jgi:RNA polymerase sigma-70 factor (ECF subfamily)
LHVAGKIFSVDAGWIAESFRLLHIRCNRTGRAGIHLAMNDERTLVEAVLAHAPGAFERLVRDHQRLVWHVVERMVRHPEDARELSQEVFLRVYQKLEQYRHESSLATWIGRIAFSLASRHLQRKRLPIDDAGSRGDDDGDDALTRVADSFDLAEAFADAELMACVAEEMEALPPMQRTLIGLYHLDELGIAEISSITGQPEGTVKNSLFRARKRLRERLERAMGVAA